MIIDRLKGNSVTNRLMGCNNNSFETAIKTLNREGRWGKTPVCTWFKLFLNILASGRNYRSWLVFTLEYKGDLSGRGE